MKRFLFILLLFPVLLQAQIGRYPFYTTPSASSASTLLNGIVAYYNLDEASGTVLDAVGNNDGTNVGATANQTGKIGTGYVFADPDSIIMGNTSALSSLTGDGSISAWIYATGVASYSMIVSKMDFNNDVKGYVLWNSGDGIRAGGGSATGYDYTSTAAGITISANTWTLIVFTWDVVAGTMKIYKNNGSPYVDNGLIMTFVSSYAGFQIGHNSYSGTSFVGTLDEIGLWDRALTDAEVLELYNSGTGKTYPF